MTANYKSELSAAKERLGALGKAAPDMMQGFGRLAKAATADGTFSIAQKELIATAIAVVKGCHDCILYHVDGSACGSSHSGSGNGRWPGPNVFRQGSGSLPGNVKPHKHNSFRVRSNALNFNNW